MVNIYKFLTVNIYKNYLFCSFLIFWICGICESSWTFWTFWTSWTSWTFWISQISWYKVCDSYAHSASCGETPYLLFWQYSFCVQDEFWNEFLWSIYFWQLPYEIGIYYYFLFNQMQSDSLIFSRICLNVLVSSKSNPKSFPSTVLSFVIN